ncbi:threonine--tRNA ligase [Candidatus Legionella polyplacis]|uniref:Threonine--tRNA ligase n=1 Tax=Candidatus Legionella polyplacis TaxID=2005262 RepID=A0ABZ2GZS1_9GAMM
MPNIKFSNNRSVYFDSPVTVLDVAKTIDFFSKKKILAGNIGNKFVDVNYLIDKDSFLSIITEDDNDAMFIIRHSMMHLLANVVKFLFPDVLLVSGSSVKEEFYYDFYYKRSFDLNDLHRIENKMYEFVKNNYSIERIEFNYIEAISFFKEKKEIYKVKIIKKISKSSVFSLYKQGDFADLCRGPQVPFTGYLNFFKLIKVSGAYWKGNSENEMLQRIYGVVFKTKSDLDLYFKNIENLKSKDHRKLGIKLDLFHFQDIAPGMVFWHEKGLLILNLIKTYLRDLLCKNKYQEIKTPQLIDKKLWELSGHYRNFNKEMFFINTNKRSYAIKPMSCPCHVQIYNQKIHSYKELPIKFSEFGNCHRNEPSGSLHGLMRLRNMIQDDAHIFCTEKQLQNEIVDIINIIELVYMDFGFSNIQYDLAFRPKKRIGSDSIWDIAESSLKDSLIYKNIKWNGINNKGSFYGPKIECSLLDNFGRIWQCGTIQIDFFMPKNLGAMYISSNNKYEIPVMIHRAILGSLERFLGILIEHYSGSFPFWLSPVQVVILPISEKQYNYATKITKILQKEGIRVACNLERERINLKIYKYTIEKIPCLIIVGDEEKKNNMVSIRTREGINLGLMNVDLMCNFLKHAVALKAKAKCLGDINYY